MKSHAKLNKEKILLLRAGLKDDQAAFEQLYQKYSPILLDYLIRYDGNITTREELVQECFLRAWQKRRSFKATSSVKTYLIGIAKNVASEQIEKKQSENRLLQIHRNSNSIGIPENTSSSTSNSKELDFNCEETRKRLRRASDLLSPEVRKAIQVYFFEGLRGSVAAQKCGCSRSTFYERFSLAKIQLRKLLRSNKI